MEKMPGVVEVAPPVILGAATLTTRAFRGASLDELTAAVAALDDPAARLHDQALLARLRFQPEDADRLQMHALHISRVFRVARARPGRLRVLAVVLPGDLMVNTPLDFMLPECDWADVRLDLLYHLPGCRLPLVIPEHDVAVFAAADPDHALCNELQTLFEAWPRPAVNAPGLVPGLARDVLSANLSGIASICSPRVGKLSRAVLQDGLDFSAGPLLVRPAGSHAGQGLDRIGHAAALTDYLEETEGERFFVTPFVDYASADGRYRKYRVAFIEGQAWLCHMAISDHWMVHYLNAGMAEDAGKRAEEAQAMAEFETTFAARHCDAFAALNQVIGLDYFSIDCAELSDGRLVVFEADNAAIIHMMDPPALFPYKAPQMEKVFKAFCALLARRAGERGRVGRPKELLAAPA